MQDIIRNRTFPPLIEWLPLKSIDQFYADPFVRKTPAGTYEVFVEDFSFQRSYGRISILTIDRQLRLLSQKTLLDTQRHLSYPFLYSEKGANFVFPEASESGRLSCYVYDPSAHVLEFLQDVIELPVLDPTILKRGNRYWLFGTLRGQHSNSRLHIFHAEQLLGPYTAHPQNPVTDALDGSRPAGGFIEVDGNLYRPSQNCAREYGESIAITRITLLTEQRFVEEPYMKISLSAESRRQSGIRTIHTINVADDLIVVDGGSRSFAPHVKLGNLAAKRAYHRRIRHMSAHNYRELAHLDSEFHPRQAD